VHGAGAVDMARKWVWEKELPQVEQLQAEPGEGPQAGRFVMEGRAGRAVGRAARPLVFRDTVNEAPDRSSVFENENINGVRAPGREGDTVESNVWTLHHDRRQPASGIERDVICVLKQHPFSNGQRIGERDQ
jgi:hypothetical protein